MAGWLNTFMQSDQGRSLVANRPSLLSMLQSLQGAQGGAGGQGKGSSLGAGGGTSAASTTLPGVTTGTSLSGTPVPGAASSAQQGAPSSTGSALSTARARLENFYAGLAPAIKSAFIQESRAQPGAFSFDPNTPANAALTESAIAAGYLPQVNVPPPTTDQIQSLGANFFNVWPWSSGTYPGVGLPASQGGFVDTTRQSTLVPSSQSSGFQVQHPNNLFQKRTFAEPRVDFFGNPLPDERVTQLSGSYQ